MFSRLDELAQRLATSHIQIQLHVSDNEETSRLLVRRDVTVKQLIEDAKRKVLDSARADAEYNLYVNKERVSLQQKIGELDTTTFYLSRIDDFTLSDQSTDAGLSPQGMIVLLASETQARYEINTFPAIIGRVKSTVPLEDLQANLGDHPNGRTVSGRHAEITRSSDGYTITNISRMSKVVVDGLEVSPNETAPLLKDSRLSIGKVELTVADLS